MKPATENLPPIEAAGIIIGFIGYCNNKMNFFGIVAEQLAEYRQLLAFLKKGGVGGPPVMLTGISHIQKAHFLSALCCNEDLPPFLILTANENEGLGLVEDINTLSQSEKAVLYPAKDFNLGKAVAMSREYEHKRIDVLCRIIDGGVKGVIATPEAAAQITLSKTSLISRTITLKSGMNLPTAEFAMRLISLGYSRTDLIEGEGQFSIRGLIVDVYPVNSRFPIRIELWGDEVDTISAFDVETQRRLDTIKEIKIPPAAETLFEEGELLTKLTEIIKNIRGKYSEKAKLRLNEDIERLKGGLLPFNSDKYLSLSSVSQNGLFDFLNSILICEQAKCKESFRAALTTNSEEIVLQFEHGELFRGIDRHMLSKSEYEDLISKNTRAYFDTFLRGGDIQLSELISISSTALSPWGGEYKLLLEELKAYINRGFAAAVFAGTEKAAKNLALDLRSDNLPADYYEKPNKLFSKRIYVLEGALSAGFEYPEALCVCLTHAGGNILSKSSAVRETKKRKIGEEIKSLTEINIGDYIVHTSYGIGVFEGVTKLTSDNVTKDYIKLKYDGADILYIPVTQLDLISRYIGNTDSLRLSKLNSGQWQKAKTKARAAAVELADELIKLYTKRLKSKGYAFQPDGEEMRDFENHFNFIETEDQLKCIREIKRDMEDIRPMDRLLCGDVGFGKTEVAFRAAFKCIMEGKQCALLCPTTVLAWQHYQTASKRMENFPVKIELLSRFRTPKQVKDILSNLKKGLIDFVIGTHRLVQDDVEFRDLGLAIIDEEQRFGVNHKEKFKKNFTSTDILTLSATPIPRTLNMAMSGIRDMSVIETPPQDRQPVTTYVIEQDYGVITAAIEKEIRRNGQVYYIHNRVESILTCAGKIKALCPNARVGVAHGKMSEDEMLDVWQRLLERDIDILVCTTIIETGIDVPNVNTLIIEDSDRMGLAQLHQLRGRVGRTNRRAFAYFTFKIGKTLTEIAEKRLNAIREYTKFGSGFRIAMRDLEIRGSGSVLGERQSGHLSAVGYDLYLKILNEVVAEKRGEKPQQNEICPVDIKIDAYIPESYIGNAPQRINCYKRIAEIKNSDDALDLIDELIDRYGEPPKSVNGLILVAEVRNMAQNLGFNEIMQSNSIINCFIKEPNVDKIGKAIKNMGNRISLNLTGRTGISIKLLKGESPLDALALFLKSYNEGN